MVPLNKFLLVVVAAVAVLASMEAGHATANYGWDGGGGDGQWGTAANWSSNAVPAADDGAQFNDTYGTGGRTIDLGGGTRTISQLLINNTATSGLVTLQNGTLVLNPAAASGFSPSAALNWAGTSTQDFTIDANVTLQSGIGNIYFYTRPSASTGTRTLSFGGNIQIANDTATTQYLFRFGANAATVLQKADSVLSDNGATESTLLIDFAGTGQTVTLNGANTFTLNSGKVVSLTGSGGTLNLGNNTALGVSGNLLSLGSTGTTNASDTRSVLITGAQTIQNSLNVQTYSGLNTIGGSNTTGTATYAGTVALNRHASAASNVTNLTAASGGTVTFSGVVSNGTGTVGGAGIQKIGAGTVILGNANTFTGGTTVTAGTLLVNNASGSGLGTDSVVVNGGTLGGTGAFTGGISVNSGGTLAPGASVQSLSSGALSFASGSTFAYELDSGAAASAGADLQRVSGNLTLNGTVTLTLANLSVGTFALGTKFTLINYNGSWNNGLFTYNASALTDDSTFSFNGQTWEIDYNATSGGTNFSSEFLASSSYVNLTAVVPESSSFVLAVLSLMVMVIFRRRRKL